MLEQPISAPQARRHSDGTTQPTSSVRKQYLGITYTHTSLSCSSAPDSSPQFPRASPWGSDPRYCPCLCLHHWPSSGCFLLPAPSQGLLAVCPTCDPVSVLAASTPAHPSVVSTTLLKVGSRIRRGEASLLGGGWSHNLCRAPQHPGPCSLLVLFCTRPALGASVSLKAQALLPCVRLSC